MGSINKQAPATFKARKATFKVVKGSGNEQVLTAVNRRAHIVAKKLGKRSLVTRAQLKATSGKGSYKIYIYNAAGVRQPLR